MDSLINRFRKDVLDRYVELVQAKYRFHPNFQHVEALWKTQLSQESLVNGPYLERSQNYKQGEGLAELPLNDFTRQTVGRLLSNRPLWSHQCTAIRAVLSGKSTVIATGTSSGKTLCYQIPILDDLLRDPSPGLRAIIIYPLNALVNDQLSEWEKILENHQSIKFARFTGQTPADQREYEVALYDAFISELANIGWSQQEKKGEVDKKVREAIEKFPNRLNHRDAIRLTPPQILITNFSMLEYLLERPVDAPIFENARLKFVVLDEAHAYRGIQATEIAFLLRRLKDRLRPEKLVCIATSATLGDRDDPTNMARVREFASDLFGEIIMEPSPVLGEDVPPTLKEPHIAPSIEQYIEAARELNTTGNALQAARLLGSKDIRTHFNHDKNFHRLRTEILKIPHLLKEAAGKLWPDRENEQAAEGLSAMLELLTNASTDGDMLPTRLHYFVKAQDGLHICLNPNCPGRRDGRPAFFVSRHSELETPDGFCPECFIKSQHFHSQLVEVVGCRRCGYLFGALQDLGPRYAQDPERQPPPEPMFDSFSTELGWNAESFWSYFSVDGDLPYPYQFDPSDCDGDDDEDAEADLMHKPCEIEWCMVCGKRHGEDGDVCRCDEPHHRTLKIFHRQCPAGTKAKDIERLWLPEKSLLPKCPNCGTRRGSGPEPLQRFQESDDAMGLAMAIPLSHFETKQKKPGEPPSLPKLLCFTDNRQRAAVFPSLLEEETFSHEFSRRVLRILVNSPTSFGLVELGEDLAKEAENDQQFFLPTSREVEGLDQRVMRNLWITEVFGYFTLPDPRRESVEDLGLVAVEYQFDAFEQSEAAKLFIKYGLKDEEACAALQTLLAIMRRRKAISLPKGVDVDAAVFGPVDNKVAYALSETGRSSVHNWLPVKNRTNVVINYIQRLIKGNRENALAMAKDIWQIIERRLIQSGDVFMLDHELLRLRKVSSRYACSRCGTITTFSARNCCPRLGCVGVLDTHPFDLVRENIITRWIVKIESPMFQELRAEEHTAQIRKDLAKIIEDRFRADSGVNLISSTTTFEMGINIGSLQKVLLRNAPPSCANYVQRVGRAGRGGDKNAICITMCRRFKYDSDMWRQPSRLMTGKMRTPTVFLDNKIISQRHFNAIAFAKFLRKKVLDEKVLGELRQTMRLEAFLNPDIRQGIPKNYLKYDRPAETFMNFPVWLENATISDIFQTETCQTDFERRLGFAEAIKEARERYEAAIGNAEREMSALNSARNQASREGKDKEAGELGQGIQNLLSTDIINFLAENGFLPRYAFPLDVVTLETRETRWSKDSEVDLSRSRGIAISEFAPGAQVVAHKTVYTSAGLYVLGERDKPERHWYSKCPGCGQVRTGLIQEAMFGKPCDVCGRMITRQYTFSFVMPGTFSIRIENKSRRRKQHYRVNTLIRQRQGITNFIDQIEDSQFENTGLFSLALKDHGKLFRYNRGPKGDGFMLCPKCGFSMPAFARKQRGGPHKRLRPLGGPDDCDYTPWTQVAYGHEFESFCFIIRPNRLPSSTESLAFALQKGMCAMLEIDTQEIGVSLRSRNKDSKEIILYDQTPGGAGFVKDAKNNFEKVIKEAITLCRNCFCESSCYDCLKDYGNQSYHDKLDRQSVLNFFAE